MTAQLILPFAPRKSFNRDDFFVSSCNENALMMIDQYQKWPHKMLLLIGEKGSGKTHLAHLFAGKRYEAKNLKEEDILSFPSKTVIEDIEEITDERVLFHAYNAAKERGIFLLMTAKEMPDFMLPDLQTRLRSVPQAVILAPDDELISSVLCKLFSDRQVDIEPEVIGYLLKHMERTFKSLRDVVEKADKLSLIQKRRITVPLIKQVISS